MGQMCVAEACNKRDVVVITTNKPIENQLIYKNMVYEIQDEFDLSNRTIVIPDGCTLRFSGGKFKNGIIDLQNTIIESLEKCFERVVCKGALNGTACAKWFKETDDNVLQNLFVISNKIELEPDVVYSQTSTIDLNGRKGLEIEGNGSTIRLISRTTFQMKLIDCSSWTIRNLTFDGNQRVRMCIYGNNNNKGLMQNVCICNIKDVEAKDFGIYGAWFYGSSDLSFENCLIKDIEANSFGVAAGLVFWPNTDEKVVICKNISIVNSRFYRVLADIHKEGKGADCIYFGGEYVNDNYVNATVENCFFEDFGKRAIKVQAKSVTVKNCTMCDSKNFDFEHFSVIQFFGSKNNAFNNTIDVKYSSYGISVYALPTRYLENGRVILDKNQFIDKVDIANNYIHLNGNSLISVGVDNINACRYDNIAIINNILSTDNALAAIAIRGRGKNLSIRNNTINLLVREQGPSENYVLDGIDIYQTSTTVSCDSVSDVVDCYYEDISVSDNTISGVFGRNENYNKMNNEGIYAVGRNIDIKNNEISNFTKGVLTSQYGSGISSIKQNRLLDTNYGVVTSSDGIRVIENEFEGSKLEDISVSEKNRVVLKGNRLSVK